MANAVSLAQGKTPVLRPPARATVPLWLALLLKKQKRANVVPPPWLHPASLRELIKHETVTSPDEFSPPPPPAARAGGRGAAGRATRPFEGTALSPPFVHGCTAAAPAGFLPYHWFEVAEALLAHAADDMSAPAGEVRALLRDLVEARAAKMRRSTAEVGGFGGGVASLRGVGAMELAEGRGFVLGLVDGVRRLGAAAETARREDDEEDGGAGDDSDEDMVGILTRGRMACIGAPDWKGEGRSGGHTSCLPWWVGTYICMAWQMPHYSR